MAKKNIVVVDDEIEICKMLSIFFTQEGYNVTYFTDPEEALNAVMKKSPDLILLDIKMPKMDGIELCEKIKKKDKSIRIIIITAYGDVKRAVESMRSGASDLIEKPMDLKSLLKAVKECLGDK
jgi:DNA-binding NtrC family response regulator